MGHPSAVLLGGPGGLDLRLDRQAGWDGAA
jgi:hypothetical protein